MLWSVSKSITRHMSYGYPLHPDLKSDVSIQSCIWVKTDQEVSEVDTAHISLPLIPLQARVSS